MKPYTFQRPSASQVCREAGAVLSQGGNRLLMIEAILLCFLLVPAYLLQVQAVAICSTLFPALPLLVWEWILAAVLFLFSLFLAIPLLLGLLGIASSIERGNEAVLSDLFVAFSGLSAYRRALAFAWRFLAVCTPIILCIWLGTGLIYAIFPEQVAPFLVFLAVVLLLLWLFALLNGRFPLAFRWAMPDGSVAYMPKRTARFCARGFWKGFWWRILLGILTVGILLLIDVIPKLLIAYFRYCRYVNETIIQLEE